MNPNLAKSNEKRAFGVALAAIAGSIALGVGGTFGVRDVLHRKSVAEGNKKLEPYIKPTLVDIGTMALKLHRTNPKLARVEQFSDWGEASITVKNKIGKLEVAMENIQGNLEPITTRGAEVTLNRPDITDPRGGIGYEHLFLDYENGQWHADGQVYISPARNQVAFLEVSADDPNLTNMVAIDQKAREMSRQVLGLEVPPHK